MRPWIIVTAAVLALALPALAQDQRPASPSPYLNVLHNDSTVSRHVVAEQHITVPPYRNYVAWGTGFIVSGPGVHHHGPLCFWIDGHYEYYTTRVWIPAHWEQRYIPPVYQWQLVNGQQALVMVAAARYEPYFVPGRYEVVTNSVWVPGCWSCGY